MKCKAIVKGYAKGEVLYSEKPINFLVVDDDGKVNDVSHSLSNKSIANKILIIPNAIGSSVGAYKLYALKLNNKAPLSIVCKKADIITASGCAIAKIPLVQFEDVEKLMKAKTLVIDADNSIIEIIDQI
jgi:predicted aconitase with swiveling domain